MQRVTLRMRQWNAHYSQIDTQTHPALCVCDYRCGAVKATSTRQWLTCPSVLIVQLNRLVRYHIFAVHFQTAVRLLYVTARIDIAMTPVVNALQVETVAADAESDDVGAYQRFLVTG